jgi:hypothetical protein
LLHGDATAPDAGDIRRYGRMAALHEGHDPRDIDQWSEHDLRMYAHWHLANPNT